MESKREVALERIRNLITTGEWHVGVLRSENQLGELLGMSRSPIRDALSALAQEGLIEQIPQVGVRPKELTTAEFVELFELRLLLEPYAAKKLAQSFDHEAFRVLQSCLKSMEEAMQEDDLTTFLSKDAEFHWQTAVLGHQPLLGNVIRQTCDRIKVFGKISSPKRELMKTVLGEHRAIFSAAAGGDSDKASAAAICHIERTKERLNVGKGVPIFSLA